MSTRSHPDMRSAAKIIAFLHRRRPSTSSSRRLLFTSASAQAGRMHLVLALLLAATPSVAAPAARWQWPVDPPRVIARAYLAPATPYGSGHRGIDIETTTTAVYAPADGVVHFAGYVVDRPVLSLSHAGGVLSSYEPVATTLVAGDTVHRGDRIGSLEGGHCAVVSCLHLGVRVGGEYVSPLLFLGGVERSVLLPVRHEGAPARTTASAARSTRACRSGSCPGSRARAAPARRAGLRRRRAGG